MGHEIVTTSRANPDLIKFVLEDQSTWSHLPGDSDGTFFTMPVKDSKTVKVFLSEMAAQLGKIVCIGSTSEFAVTEHDQVVTEKSTLDTNNPRVQAENEILRAGGICVISAGIYGPGRSPLRWVREGRIVSNERYVNFIHVEDLANILGKAMLSGKPGEKYLASDGQPMRWSDIISIWHETPGLMDTMNNPNHEISTGISTKISRKVDSARSLRALGIKLKHQNVIKGVASFEHV
jgi:nucleoside-diphosphate-sugar epimerase